MARLRIGVIGSGFIGRAHSIALSAVGTVFAGIEPPILDMIAESDARHAAGAARDLGFRRSTGDWRELVNDREIDVVYVCSPNYLHHEMTLAAIAAGKHVHCEKPLALTSADAREVTLAARAHGRFGAHGTHDALHTRRFGSGDRPFLPPRRAALSR